MGAANGYLGIRRRVSKSSWGGRASESKADLDRVDLRAGPAIVRVSISAAGCPWQPTGGVDDYGFGRGRVGSWS
jgi:hypothetical protein